MLPFGQIILRAHTQKSPNYFLHVYNKFKFLNDFLIFKHRKESFFTIFAKRKQGDIYFVVSCLATTKTNQMPNIYVLNFAKI